MSFGELSFCETSHGEMGFCELLGHQYLYLRKVSRGRQKVNQPALQPNPSEALVLESRLLELWKEVTDSTEKTMTPI